MRSSFNPCFFLWWQSQLYLNYTINYTINTLLNVDVSASVLTERYKRWLTTKTSLLVWAVLSKETYILNQTYPKLESWTFLPLFVERNKRKTRRIDATALSVKWLYVLSFLFFSRFVFRLAQRDNGEIEALNSLNFEQAWFKLLCKVVRI